jgi:hypothetical protein
MTMSHSRLQRARWHFDDGLTWKIGAAMLSLLACCFAPDGVIAKEFPPFGDRGDAQAADHCKPGTFLVGLRVRSGDWIDQIQMICAPLDNHGSTAGERNQGPVRGGNGGGAPVETTCGPHEIIMGVGLAMTPGNRQVRMFRFNCASFAKGGGRHDIDLGNTTHGGPTVRQDCPNDEAVTGMQIHYGKHVNAIGLICGHRPQQLPGTGSDAPAGGHAAGLGEKIASFAEAQLNKCVDGKGNIRPSACPTLAQGAVGDGECTHLVVAALKNAGAKPGDTHDQNNYVWGQVETVGTMQRGDIIQLNNARFTGPNGASSDFPKHTAIIVAKSGDKVTVMEQNVNGQRFVHRDTYDFSWPHTGSYVVYRPLSQ